MMCLPKRGQGGFTLLELLLVVIILGIVTAVFVPQIGAGLSGARLATGARTVLQAARYARTMALLHQAETELVVGLQSGVVRVEAAGGASGNAGAADLPPAPRPVGSGESAASPDTEWETAATNRPAAVVTAARFAEEIHTTFTCEGIQFRFLGYEDSLDDAAPADPGDAAAECRIRFRSNGTCRPFGLRVLADEEEWMELVFDVTGAGKVRDDAH